MGDLFPFRERMKIAMPEKSRRIRNFIFLALVLIFAILLALFSPGGRLLHLPFAVVVVLAIALGVLGLALVVLTARLKEPGAQKIFFVLAGASAAGVPIFAVLHNLVYGLFIWWFGKGFWEAHGMPDEPVFFILAILICPALFLVGTAVSILFLIKETIDSNRWPRARP
jgi:hypothetical protein